MLFNACCRQYMLLERPCCILLLDHNTPCRNSATHRIRSSRTVRQDAVPMLAQSIETAFRSAFSLHRYWTSRHHQAVSAQLSREVHGRIHRLRGLLISLPCSEWITHQHRDTYASIIGHPPLLSYVSVADGESIGRAKFEMCEVCHACLLRLVRRWT